MDFKLNFMTFQITLTNQFKSGDALPQQSPCHREWRNATVSLNAVGEVNGAAK